jgi:uncharacterized repeat protein (TIGR03837 family)
MHADIFCRVVDNYGDIGVTWRLARQLQSEHGWSIRLWVDILDSFNKLEARVSPERNLQIVDNIEVVSWTNPAPDIAPHPVVIASFSCELPPAFQARMTPEDTLWINLEYLSAEAWVEGCHGLPSLRSDGLNSNFFFPGFTSQTGGLIRESGLLSARDSWQADPNRQLQWIKSLGVSPEGLQTWRSGRLISAFCYPQAPLSAFCKDLASDPVSTLLLIPKGIASDTPSGQQGNLHIARIPFTTQQEYDQTLWTADLNIVRGEDSFVRALWAAKPAIWHIYPQTEDTHLVKLDAWLARTSLPAAAQSCIRNWNLENASAAEASSFHRVFDSSTFSAWASAAKELAAELARNQNLAESLNLFCRTKSKH